MKKKQYILILLFIGAVAAAYFLGTLRSKTSTNALRNELEDLVVKQSEADVVKRVSRQMEDIAYQQKAVSDQQRERAEEQSAIAEKMRYVAEQESHSAHLAEEKAKKAATEAESERANALYHQEIAEMERDEANLARSIADTLTFVTLGSKLGKISIEQYEGGHGELASQLAYTGWSLLEKYNGNTLQNDTFESLSKASESVHTYGKAAKGRITAIHSCNHGFVYVSDYGEIGYCPETGSLPSSLFSDSRFDFRDVLFDDGAVFALSFNSSLCKVNLRSESAVFPLPEDSYLELLETDGSKLLAVGKKSMVIWDKQKCEVEKQLCFPKNVSTATSADNRIIIFFEDGTVSGYDAYFEPVTIKPFRNRVVTDAFYEVSSGSLYLGYDDGDTQIISGDGTNVSFSSHSSRISSISATKELIISSSFDKTIDICTASSPYSVTMTYKEWPMCICVLNDFYVAVGFDGGTLKVFNVSPRRMAEKIREKGNSSLNIEDWKRYVGENVPYTKF